MLEAEQVGGDGYTADEDTCAPTPPQTSSCLHLHIVYSDTYRVPVLLLQGRGADGSIWPPATLRTHLASLCDGTGHGSLPESVVTQFEHPVLRLPFCCVDPCETAALMRLMMVADDHDSSPAHRLDYLSAWWSVMAPRVGAECHAAWMVP